MKLIGKGYWYNVYDLGNGRVIKLEKGFFQKIRNTYQLEEKKIFPYLKALFRLFTSQKKIIDSYNYIRSNVEPELVGSPRFLDGINYEQDVVEILGSVITRLDFIKKKKIIDRYIQNVIQCWQNGFADRVYNFTINNGMDDSGRLILLDFNEITFLKEEVLRSIISKRWLRSWSFGQIDIELQQYYQQQMDLLITPETLDTNWVQKQNRTIE